jgi:hypothetical protein
VIPNSFLKDYNPYSDVLTGDWFNKKAWNHHTGEVLSMGNHYLKKSNLNDMMESKQYEALDHKASTLGMLKLMNNTTIWANFQKFNPNKELVEINVYESCF